MKLKFTQAEVSPIAPMLIFGFTALLAGVLTLFLPETKNVTLPDTIKVGQSVFNNQFFYSIYFPGGRRVLQKF